MTEAIDRAAIVEAVAAAWSGGIIETLSDYTRIECLSPLFDPQWAEHGHLHRAAELLADWSRSRPIAGLAVEVLELPGRTPLLLVEIPAGDSAANDERALIYGHLDKQPPQGQWRPGLGPYLPVRDGDQLYGRGTADDGYSLFAALAAIESLAGRHPAVTILIEASEESGSPDLDPYLELLADRLGRLSLVLCLDSGCLTYDRLWMTSSLRGGVGITVRVDVLTEGVHSGMAGGVVPSSFRVIRQLLSRLEDQDTGALLLPELNVEVPESHRRQAEALAVEFPEAVARDLPVVDGLVLAGSTPAEQLLARTWGPSLSVTGAEGLPPAAQAGNVLRPFTTVKLSLRLPPTSDAATATAAVLATLQADPPEGATVTTATDVAADGWVAPEPEPWLAAALDAASQASFGRPAAAVGEGGTIPFLATLAARYPGTPLVATGVLGPQSNAHGPNEFLHLPMAEAVSVAVACALAGLASR